MGVRHRRFGVDDDGVAVPVASLKRGLQVLLSLVAALAGWQAVVVVTGLPSVILPSPADVASVAVANAGTMWVHVQYTMWEVALGWLAGVGIGGAFAFSMATSRRLRLVVYPYLIAVRILPLVVLVPILILLVGPTLLTRVLMAAILTFFPVTIATLDGLLSVPDDQIALFESVGTPLWKRLLFVHAPNALPSIFAGLKIATPLAVEGVILAEFLAATRGIGYRMLVTASNLQTALLFAYMFALMALGVGLFALVLLADSLVRWNESDADVSDHLWTGGAIDDPRDPLAQALVVGSVVGLVAVWQFAASVVPHARLFLPAPASVAAILVSSASIFVDATVQSSIKFGAGWAVGAAVGFTLGAVAALVPRLRTVVYTYLVGARVMPVIAFAPVLLVWLGVSFQSAVVLVAAATFFPVAMGAAAGFERLPAAHDDLFHLVDAPAWRVFLVRLRYAAPALFSGVKLSAITGLSGVVIAEWVVAEDGLGVLVLQQTRTFQPDLAFAAVVWLFALGAGTFGLAAACQRRLSW
jgi:ABC-type nitrate/sulfonate/bicarbonate transport system permease component